MALLSLLRETAVKQDDPLGVNDRVCVPNGNAGLDRYVGPPGHRTAQAPGRRQVGIAYINPDSSARKRG